MRAGKNAWVLLLTLLAGIVAGSFLGQALSGLQYTGWLAYGQAFGIESPMKLELGVISLQFALMLRVNVAGVLGMAAAYAIYRRMP